MTLPTTGPLSLSAINIELGRSETALISLDSASNGEYVAINTNSTSRPSGVNPDSISEWYGYDQNASPPVSCYTISLGFSSTSSSTACLATPSTFSIDSPSIYTATRIYRGTICGLNGLNGYYSNGIDWFQTSGGVIIATGACA